MNIAIYSRKSKFTGKGESIENQIQLCKEYAVAHFDVEEIYIYEDEGFSGGNVERPQFQKLLRDAERKKFSVLICYRLDRISRNVLDFSSTLEKLQENNISFVSIREQFDTSTPMGRAMMYIASVFAQLERETLAERIKDNMYQLARTGRWLGGVFPTGFKSEPIIYIDENMKERKMAKLVPIPEELEIVKMVFYKYLELQSLQKLESYFMVNGIKTRGGSEFQKVSLKQILHNPVYVMADQHFYEYMKAKGADVCGEKHQYNGKFGAIAYNKRNVNNTKMARFNDKSEWIVAIGKHKGVIPGKVWAQVHDLYEKNIEKAPRKGTSAAALLSGLMRCSCGSTMRVLFGVKKPNSDDRYYYYVCNRKIISKGAVCDSKRLNGYKTDLEVIDKLKNAISPSMLKNIEIMKKQNMDKSFQLKAIQDKISQNKKGIDNLVKQVANFEGSAAAEFLIKEIERLALENKELEAKLEDNYDDHEIKNMNLDLFREAFIRYGNMIDDADFEEKRKLIQGIVQEIVWDGQDLNVKLLKF